MEFDSDRGLVRQQSHGSFDETMEKLQHAIHSKGLTIFAIVDHSGEAAKASLQMPPTKLLIFGSPKAGTPLMIASPSLAIDLPLKVLVAQDADGQVWISHNSPEYLRQRHNIPDDLLKNISGVGPLLQSALQAA